MSDFPAILNLASLDGSDGFRLFDGNADSLGYSVRSAGDVNGDGLSDIIVGAPYTAGGAGMTYVLFGKVTGFSAEIDLSTLDGSDGFALEGATEFTMSGFAVSGAGDLNGDGYDDVIVGAPDASGGEAGAAYVVYGHDGPFDALIDLESMGAATGFSMTFPFDDCGCGSAPGFSVSFAGDVNQDGRADIIIGAPYAYDGYGASFVVYGRSTNFPANLDLSTLDGTDGFQMVDPENLLGFVGAAVSDAGDINGDGYGDLIVGAPYGMIGGSNYVVLGSSAGFGPEFFLSDLDGSNGFEVYDSSDCGCGTGLGIGIGSAGDVNADGRDDLIFGTPFAGDNIQGGAFVMFGASRFRASLDLATVDSRKGFWLTGFEEGSETGISVRSAGDVNGDGFADIIVGADLAGVDAEGQSYVVFGKAGGFGAEIDLGSLDGDNGFRIEGAGPGAEAGLSVSGAGDLNGDGFDDLIVGAPMADLASGASYVVFGRAPTEAVTRVGTDIGNTIRGGDFDDRISGRAGDDFLYGGGGNDRISGGTGIDHMEGGTGADIYYVDNTSDIIVEVPGDRNMVLSTASYTLSENITVLRISGSDNLFAIGNSDYNRIIGNAGNNLIAGMLGDDKLQGNGGMDSFLFDTALGPDNVDKILDFEIGIDKINLDQTIFNELDLGVLSAADFSTDRNAGTAIWYQQERGRIFYDADGDGAHSRQLFAQVTAEKGLAADDFIIVA